MCFINRPRPLSYLERVVWAIHELCRNVIANVVRHWDGNWKPIGHFNGSGAITADSFLSFVLQFAKASSRALMSHPLGGQANLGVLFWIGLHGRGLIPILPPLFLPWLSCLIRKLIILTAHDLTSVISRRQINQTLAFVVQCKISFFLEFRTFTLKKHCFFPLLY